MKIFILLLISAIIGITVNLRVDELCKNKGQECKGKYNSYHEYSVDCKQVKCHGNHSFYCNEIYCTNNAKSCIDFYNLNRPSISTLRMPQRKIISSVYVSQIKDCKLIDYKLKHQDVCLTSEECFFLKESKNRYPLFYQQPPTIETRCPCKDKHNYHCGNKYCTINSLVCDHLKTTKFINKLKSISKCMK